MAEITKLAEWHEEFINYLINPYDNRTLDAFADSVGISYLSLWRYRRKHEELINSQVAGAKASTYAAMRPAANKALARNLAKGDNQTLKLFYQLIGDLVERSEVKTNDSLTVEQKRDKLASLFEELKNKQLVLPHNPVNQLENKTNEDR